MCHFVLAALQPLERRGPRVGALAGVDRRGLHAGLDEEVAHEVGVALRDAEREGALPAALPPLVEHVLGPRPGRHRGRQRLFVEPGAAPRDVAVVDLVRHPIIMKGTQEPAGDALDQIAAVDEVLAAELEQVATIRALRGRRQAEQEAGLEVVDEPPIGLRRGVVELVDDQVVEGPRVQLVEVRLAPEGQDGGEDDLAAGVLLLAVVLAEARLRPDAPEGPHRLQEDLVAVRDEEDAAGLLGVEGREPGLAEAGRQDDEAGAVAGGAGALEGKQGFLLDFVGLGWGLGRLAEGSQTAVFGLDFEH